MSSEETSPVIWKKPSDVMKLRQVKLRKRNLQKRLGILDAPESASSELSSRNSMSKVDAVFMNPFRYSPNKRLKKSDDASGERKCQSAGLLERLQERESKQQGASSVRLCELIAGLESESQEDSTLDEDEEVVVSCLAVDWSLKAGVRVSSPQPFPWSGRVTTPEEASGVTSFTRCLPLCGGGLLSVQLDTSPNAQLFQCCQVWMHPSLPWLNLYPRHRAKRASSAAASPVPLHPQQYTALHSDWCCSFRSLFHLLRARQCPYFYLCANNFTVLFRASGINSNPQVHAFVTPTSTGLRAAFTEEGVEYSMPLASSTSSHTSKDQSADEDEETDAWLKRVGVDGHVMASLSQENNTAKKSQQEFDYHPQSLVYVEDSNVHALFNYLLNSKRCTPTWGPLAGVSPTLLSPVAFTGGTLRSLQMRHRHSEQLHVLDITGPVLPHTIHYLHMLLTARSPRGDFHLSLSTLEETAPFSTADEHITVKGTAPPVFSQQGLSDCGLEGEILQNMCLPFKTGVLSEIEMHGGKTTWT